MGHYVPVLCYAAKQVKSNASKWEKPVVELDDKRQRLSALDKSILVLEAIAAQPQAVGLPDLTAKLNIPRQTLHRILQQLESMDLVKREPARDRYAIGSALTRLSLSALHSDNQSAPARSVLRALVDDLNETCNLGILRGDEFEYLERIECNWSLRIRLPLGERVPAHCTAGGKLMLAYLDAQLRADILRGAKLNRFTPNTLTSFKDLEAQFETIRSEGFAVNNEEFSIGTLGLAVPIFDADKNARAALALHAPTARLSERDFPKLVGRLRSSASRIGELWGLA